MDRHLLATQRSAPRSTYMTRKGTRAMKHPGQARITFTALGALAAAERRAPHTQAERATTRDRLRAEGDAAREGGG